MMEESSSSENVQSIVSPNGILSLIHKGNVIWSLNIGGKYATLEADSQGTLEADLNNLYIVTYPDNERLPLKTTYDDETLGAATLINSFYMPVDPKTGKKPIEGRPKLEIYRKTFTASKPNFTTVTYTTYKTLITFETKTASYPVHQSLNNEHFKDICSHLQILSFQNETIDDFLYRDSIQYSNKISFTNEKLSPDQHKNVYKGTFELERAAAVKFVEKYNFSQLYKRMWRSNTDNHPNIIRVFGADFLENIDSWIVAFEKGDATLHEFLNHDRRNWKSHTSLTKHLIFGKFVTQMIDGVYKLLNLKLTHTKLNPYNMLVVNDTLKISGLNNLKEFDISSRDELLVGIAASSINIFCEGFSSFNDESPMAARGGHFQLTDEENDQLKTLDIPELKDVVDVLVSPTLRMTKGIYNDDQWYKWIKQQPLVWDADRRLRFLVDLSNFLSEHPMKRTFKQQIRDNCKVGDWKKKLRTLDYRPNGIPQDADFLRDHPYTKMGIKRVCGDWIEVQDFISDKNKDYEKYYPTRFEEVEHLIRLARNMESHHTATFDNYPGLKNGFGWKPELMVEELHEHFPNMINLLHKRVGVWWDAGHLKDTILAKYYDGSLI